MTVLTPTIDADVRQKLRAPFTVAAVMFRPLEKPNDKGVVGCLVYIDARLAAERLSMVDPAWSSQYRPLGGSAEHFPVVCALTVCGVTREDVGQNASGDRDDKHAKMAFSDALKRAAVQFGVGASLYAMPRFTVEQGGYWKKGNGKVGGLTAQGLRALRHAYSVALENPDFKARYGEPIDHGDMLHEAEDIAPVEAPPVDAAEAMPRIPVERAELLARLAVMRRPEGMAFAGRLAAASEVLEEDFERKLRATLDGCVKDGHLTPGDAQKIMDAVRDGLTTSAIVEGYPQLDVVTEVAA